MTKADAGAALAPEPPEPPEDSAAAQTGSDAAPAKPGLGKLIESGSDGEVKDAFASATLLIAKKHAEATANYTVLALLEPEDSIDRYDLDRIFTCLQKNTGEQQKDVLLVLLSQGGSIEAAYQISKLCKSHAKGKFIVVVPRQAKSAATLIALGADEIHMGPLGQLGPIDPQLDDLPALGVNQALRTIAKVSQEYPGSAEMFAAYLHRALTVYQIGYCDRISESAEQYAIRLLSNKKLSRDPIQIARELVHEYKDHGFVIDLDEARAHLGNEWVRTGTKELEFGEELYTVFEMTNFLIGAQRKKRLLVLGDLTTSSLMLRKNRR